MTMDLPRFLSFTAWWPKAAEVLARGAPAPRWVALPGRRLELGDTGWHIQLVSDPKLLPYLAVDPDGRQFYRGYELQPLKALLERHARDRAEFNL